MSRSDIPDKINGKIQRAGQMRVHSMFVVGRRDLDAHHKGNLGAKPCAEAIADLLKAIKTRRAR